jgi:hypothetical protein
LKSNGDALSVLLQLSNDLSWEGKPQPGKFKVKLKIIAINKTSVKPEEH